MSSREEEIQMNNNVNMETIEGSNIGDIVFGEEEVRNEEEDKITTHISSETMTSSIRDKWEEVFATLVYL